MDRIKIARRLRELRGHRTQVEIGKAVGVTRQAVNMYENGLRVPNDEIKIELARYFNTTVQAIFYD